MRITAGSLAAGPKQVGETNQSVSVLLHFLKFSCRRRIRTDRPNQLVSYSLVTLCEVLLGVVTVSPFA